MQRGELLLLLTGIGAVTCSIWILMGFIAPESQNLLVEETYATSNSIRYSIRYIVRSHGIDLMVGCLVALGTLILLVARNCDNCHTLQSMAFFDPHFVCADGYTRNREQPVFVRRHDGVKHGHGLAQSG